MVEGTKMTIFGEEANYNQDHCFPAILRDPFNEIYQNVYLDLWRDGFDVGRDASRKERNMMVL